MAGHNADGTSTAERSTGINAGGARADRPADAEPVAGLVVDAGFSVDGAARVEHAAVPTLRFALAVERGRRRALGAARRRRSRSPARRRGYDAARARPAVRALRAGRGLGHDAAHAAVDAHDARRAGVRGHDGGGPRRALLLRPRGGGVALPGRAVGRRGAAGVPVQRQRLLHGQRRRAADDAAVVGERGGATALPVRRVEGDDGALLPRHGVGAARARRASTGCRPTSRATRSPPGTTRWRRSGL